MDGAKQAIRETFPETFSSTCGRRAARQRRVSLAMVAALAVSGLLSGCDVGSKGVSDPSTHSDLLDSTNASTQIPIGTSDTTSEASEPVPSAWVEGIWVAGQAAGSTWTQRRIRQERAESHSARTGTDSASASGPPATTPEGVAEIYHQTTVLKVVRFGTPLEHRLRVESTSGNEGSWLEFRVTSYVNGVQEGETIGTARGNDLSVTHNGSRLHPVLPGSVRSSLCGPFALQRSLAHQPLRAHERRELVSWIPMLNQFAQLQLQAHDWVDAPQSDRRRRFQCPLLPVDVVARFVGGDRVQQQLLVTPAGWIVETQSGEPLEQLTCVLPTETDRDALELLPIDLTQQLAVPLTGGDRLTLDAKSLSWRVTAGIPRTAAAEDPFVTDLRQQLRPTDSSDSQWLLTTTDEAVCSRTATEAQLRDARANSSLVDFNSAEVTALAASLDSPPTTPEQYVQRSVAAVQTGIGRQDYQSNLASASQALRDGSGDCTEHAVLLAALCRAHGVPSRLAVGLVADASGQKMVYHMWSEVWIDGAWQAVDATRSGGRISAAHLTLFTTALSDDEIGSLPLRVLRTLGNLQLELR